MIKQDMAKAQDYRTWRSLQKGLEALSHAPASTSAVQGRFARLHKKLVLYTMLIDTKDIEELQFRMRTELLRKHWGLGEGEDLMLPHAQAELDAYYQVVSKALVLIAEHRDHANHSPEFRLQELRHKLAFFNETRHAFGRSALLLSGGARLGLLHLGVVRALWKQNLLPRVINGSSAGSLIAAMLGVLREVGLIVVFIVCVDFLCVCVCIYIYTFCVCVYIYIYTFCVCVFVGILYSLHGCVVYIKYVFGCVYLPV